jgi:hypothetical protein
VKNPDILKTDEQKRAAIRLWADVLAKKEFSTGGIEVNATLANISWASNAMDDETAAYLRQRTQEANGLRAGADAMSVLIFWRDTFPADH